MDVFILLHYAKLFTSFFLTLGLSELQKENNKILHILFLFFFQKDENGSFLEGIWG